VVKKAMSEDDPLGGVEVCARVELSESVGIVIEGGVGVGRVARPGLSLPVGEAAINPIPRQMIADAVGAVLPPGQGARVVISVPRGEELAARTINPAQGIVGGIAILGTAARSRPDGYPDTVIVSEAKNLGGDSSLAALARNNIRPPHSPEPSPAALCFMGHGSRAADANAAMYQVIELARRRTGYPIVEAGFMDLCPPSIEEAVDACVAQGARRILLFPYFLHLGHHVRRDLPDLMLRLRMKYPAVEITMAPHLGFHPKLADVVVDRIAEAEAQLMAPVRATGTGDG
jgi:hypothetical protein